jgi:hypothetical protein
MRWQLRIMLKPRCLCYQHRFGLLLHRERRAAIGRAFRCVIHELFACVDRVLCMRLPPRNAYFSFRTPLNLPSFFWAMNCPVSWPRFVALPSGETIYERLLTAPLRWPSPAGALVAMVRTPSETLFRLFNAKANMEFRCCQKAWSVVRSSGDGADCAQSISMANMIKMDGELVEYRLSGEDLFRLGVDGFRKEFCPIVNDFIGIRARIAGPAEMMAFINNHAGPNDLSTWQMYPAAVANPYWFQSEPLDR